MIGPPSFLDLLYAEASRESFDEVVARAERDGLPEAEIEELRAQRRVALRLREQFVRQRQREAELSALYETASDLTAIRDVDAILSAIVRRARQLLHADMTYLSLNDETEGASYMRVTDGALTAEFRKLRLPLGTGLLGLVAQTGAPYHTDDYQADERFLHRDYIDTAVAGEQIRAILGVPLVVDGTVIGALLAVHRTVRTFPPAEISLLTSFAAHAAVALQNARLFEKTQAALADVDEANRQIRAHSQAVEVAASAHDQLTDVLLRGGGVADVASVLADVLEGALVVYDAERRELATAGDAVDVPVDLADAIREARGSGRSVELEIPGCGTSTSRPPWPARAPRHARAAPAPGAAGPRGPADRRARGPGHRAGAAVQPLGRRGRGPGPRRAARRPALRAGHRPGPAASTGPAGRARTSTAPAWSRWPRPRARPAPGRAGRRPARGGAARAGRRPRGPGGRRGPRDRRHRRGRGAPGPDPRRGRRCTVGVVPRARPEGGRPRPTPRRSAA